MASNIVVEWLRSLHLGQYAESFIDNGYDDLEICKQVGEPDLDAIGVLNPAHRQRLLHSVRSLREEGAAAVYFTLEEAVAAHEQCLCEEAGARKEPPAAEPAAAKYADEYEEGKAELVKIPRLQLKRLLRERLAQDAIRLSLQPYSTTDGDRGYLEGLASRYADLFSTHYGDVLDHLEELRRLEWLEMSPRMRVLPASASPAALTTSLSQPIYVPGKYSPSSCLTDKEEDEIYGFGYGVFGKQMLQRQQQHKQLLLQTQVAPPTNTQPLMHHQPHNYQSCLSPRSAYFYEFPPSESSIADNCLGTGKKKATTFSRLLRGLKTHRKEKNAGCSPKHGRQPPQRILRDIRHGLMHLGREGVRGPIGDDTYMYDDEARMMGLAHAHGHWYDEPPYESDPEDFLMGTQPVPTATIQNGRVCFTLNLRNEPRGEGVISLRSAGDISLPRDGARGAPRRGLILPQSGPYPTTIIPLRSARDRESGDYAGSDIQSVSSRLSGLSVETSRSEQLEGGMRVVQGYRQIGGYRIRRPEDGLSPNSSDYEEQEESETDSQHVATVHKSADDCEGVSSLVGHVRGLRQDVQRKISRLRQEQALDAPNRRTSTDQAFPCSNSSFESLPSGSGSSTQALVRAGSNHSSISAEDNRELSPTGHGPQVLCRARAVVDFTPTIYEKDALKYKKGDIIDVINMNASGIWRGILHNKIGHFKFMNVEVLPDRLLRNNISSKWNYKHKAFNLSKSKPSTVEELLHRINLQEHVSVFVHNGYEDLELFKEIEPSDLDYLGIMHADHRARILTAVQLLHDLDCSEGDIAGSSSEGEEPKRRTTQQAESPFGRRQFPRDSGCYDAPLHIKTSPLIHRVEAGEQEAGGAEVANTSPNNLDSVVQECNNEILKRVECAQQQGAVAGSLKDADRIEPYAAVATGGAGGAAGGETGVRALDSYVVARAHGVAVEPGRARGPPCARVRYAPAEAEAAARAAGCLSEKSSDSGVSSSSLSSAPAFKPQQL